MPTPKESADLLLRLYELRREPVMRQARAWFITEFNPTSFEEIGRAVSGEKSAWLSMVVSYWDMAASLVTFGAIDREMFIAFSAEMLTVFAKVEPFLDQMRPVCRRFSDGRTTGFVATELQADEIRSFTGGKTRPTWVFAAIEVWSRLWTSTVVGRRSYRNTLALVRDVATRMTFATGPLIVTDGFEFYDTAIRRVFGPAALHAQVIKTRRHDRVVRVDRRAVIGAAWRFDEALTHSEDSSTVNTSFIERLNLTIRQSSAYLSRRTLSHARATDTLDAHLELLRCYYNFVRLHRALRFGRETRTPAMQAGLATRRLTLRDIFVSVRRVVWWLSDVRAFADLRRTAAAAVMYMPVAA